MKKFAALLLTVAALMGVSSCGEDNPGNGEAAAYSFSFDGVEMRPGDKAAPVLEALAGHSPQSSVKASCLSGLSGEDVTYVLPGFRIQTFRRQKGDADEQIRLIILNDDSVATPEGVAIGAEAQAVKDTYGAPSEETEFRLAYTRGSMRLVFGLREGKVTNISYEVLE